MTFFLLQPDGEYRASNVSPTFPGVKPKDIVRFMNMRYQTEENTVIRQFRAWVRDRIVGGGK